MKKRNHRRFLGSVSGLVALCLFAGLTPTNVQATAGSSHPVGLAFDRSGNLFVADAGSNSILKFAPNGSYTIFASKLTPEALVFDRLGNLLVSDFASRSILRFTPNGKKSTFAENVGTSFGLTLDEAGNVFVTDNTSSSIFRLTPDGKRSTVATRLYNPGAIACDSAGNLFVACSDVGEVLRISADGGQSVFVSNLGGPFGLAIDRLGNLFVGAHDSTGAGVILKFTGDGTETNFASGVGKPTGLAFDAAGNLYVSDHESGTVFKFAPDGTKMVFAVGFALEAVKFQSPDRKFVLLIDKQGKPAIIEQQSRKPVLALDAFREDEDRMIWSADSKWFAFSHRGNKETDLDVYYWKGDSFQKATLPDLPEPVIQERPSKEPLSEQIHHFDFEKTEPLRWLKSGALVVSHSLGFTNNTFQSISYSREYIITISFDTKHIGHIKNVTKQPQKVEEQHD